MIKSFFFKIRKFFVSKSTLICRGTSTRFLISYLKDVVSSQFCQRRCWNLEAVTRSCPVKMVFLKISKNSKENSCVGLRPATLLKKRLQHRCFPVNFVKYLRTPFLYRTRPVAASWNQKNDFLKTIFEATIFWKQMEKST